MTAQANPSPGFARNPQKQITVEPNTQTVTVRSGETVIASSAKASLLSEPPYPPVLYVPFDDINFDMLERTASTTHCPYKGDATYWRVRGASEDVMWAYETPFDEMAILKDHGAFHADRVTIDID